MGQVFLEKEDVARRERYFCLFANDLVVLSVAAELVGYCFEVLISNLELLALILSYLCLLKLVYLLTGFIIVYKCKSSFFVDILLLISKNKSKFFNILSHYLNSW